MSLRDGMIFGLGNPLLDISATVDLKFLEKYKLVENIAVMGNEDSACIYDELEKNYELQYVPGGSTQNTLRCLSWLLQKPNVATFMGCVGKDEYSKIMKEKSNAVGLNVVYQYNDKQPTGKCAVLITGKHRTLLGHIYASKCFTTDHFNDPSNWALVEKANVYYTAGFFLTSCPDALMIVAEHALSNNKTFSMNLAAPFVCQRYKEQFLKVLPYVNILFGNIEESKAFSKYVLGKENDDVPSIALEMANLPSKSDRERVVVITQGGDPIILAIAKQKQVKFYDVHKIPNEKIVDTNGAGDAFVGGFLAQYIKGESLDKCVSCGIWLSSLIIQQVGCTFPDKMEYKD